MKILNYFVSLLSLIFLSCSEDSNSADTLENYSVIGVLKTTSSVLNGVERFGGSNPIKSELNYSNANGTDLRHTHNLWGHSSAKTTMLYTHTSTSLKNIIYPCNM